MRKTTIRLAALCAACVLALSVMGCKNEPDSVAVQSVTLSETSLMLEPGATAKLTATVTPGDADDRTVTWSSSDTAIATVSNDGTVTAIKAGTTTVTAQAGGKEATCEVTVKLALVPVENVTLNETTLTLTRGETGKLMATVKPDNADDKTVAWSSSNTSVATVANDGTVTAVKAGEATITAQAGDMTAECKVTVNPILVDTVTLSSETLSLVPGKTEKLTPTVIPDNADDKTVTWSSSDETIATVSDDGMVTAHTKGMATITARVGDNEATCTVTVQFPTMPNGTIDEHGVLTECHGNEAAVIIPEGVMGIGDGAFKDCATLTSVTIPDSVKSIGGEAFSGCADVSVTFAGTKENWEEIVKDVAIADCVTVRCADGDDYWYNPQYWKINIYLNYEGINYYQIEKYSGPARTVRLPDYTVDIKKDAFTECANLECVQSSTDCISTLQDAFNNCATLKRVEILAGKIPGMSGIMDYTFYENTNLESVTISEGVTSIGASAFQNCKKLANVMISDGLTEIKNHAFSGCENLTKVTIPISVKSIGDWAFDNCNKLTTVLYGGTKEDWDKIDKSSTCIVIGRKITGIDGSTWTVTVTSP